jgi:hypothetical protein
LQSRLRGIDLPAWLGVAIDHGFVSDHRPVLIEVGRE